MDLPNARSASRSHGPRLFPMSNHTTTVWCPPPPASTKQPRGYTDTSAAFDTQVMRSVCTSCGMAVEMAGLAHAPALATEGWPQARQVDRRTAQPSVKLINALCVVTKHRNIPYSSTQHFAARPLTPSAPPSPCPSRRPLPARPSYPAPGPTRRARPARASSPTARPSRAPPPARAPRASPAPAPAPRAGPASRWLSSPRARSRCPCPGSPSPCPSRAPCAQLRLRLRSGAVRRRLAWAGPRCARRTSAASLARISQSRWTPGHTAPGSSASAMWKQQAGKHGDPDGFLVAQTTRVERQASCTARHRRH
ncbi:hypothetical protein C2E23DRAFT_322651 [Lenzites betulinus]|nr:hypothetical protein C2E23DRAFT_322651 [Lenzites betulinus]